jgi:hypothetical protein
MRLIEIPTWAQLVETATSPSVLPATERCRPYVCNGQFQHPYRIGPRFDMGPREADTQVKRHDGVDEQAHGPISPSVLKRGDGAIFERTEEMDCHDGAAGVQGNHATAGAATEEEDFPPLSEELYWTSLRPKGSLPKRKKRVHIEEITPRKRWRSRSETRLDHHKIPGASTLR